MVVDQLTGAQVVVVDQTAGVQMGAGSSGVSSGAGSTGRSS